MLDRIVVGTRGSRLSGIQTELVISKLKANFPDMEFEVSVIKTEGDRKPDVPLVDLAGDGIFTKDIEDALLDRKIDIAVHSLKDLPTKIHPDLAISAITEREDPRDVLISKGNLALDDLPKGARLGTESPRRIAQLKAYRDDLEILGLRGNVDTRIRKLDSGDYDAIVIAAAGVVRLGMKDRIAQYLPTSIVIPAPGQGALAVETRRNDSELNDIIRSMDDRDTRIAVQEEREFLSRLGGGCVVPIASYAVVRSGELFIEGMVGDDSGKRIIRGDAEKRIDLSRDIGADLAERLLAEGAYRLLKGEISYLPLLDKRVIVTSEEHLAEKLSAELMELGAQPVLLPSIGVRPLADFSALDAAIRGIGRYDWVVFTSGNGGRFVAERFRALGMDVSELNRAKVAAVGPATAKSLRDANVRIDFVPKKYLTSEIADGLGDVSGKRILLLRADIADRRLVDALESRGAKVEQVDAYRTVPIRHSREEINGLLDRNGISHVIFTSASEVQSFADMIGGDMSRLRASIVSIGPVTSDALYRLGMTADITAEEHTVEGIIKAILKNRISA
ncbi:MAG: hydroxymethylbilane synthase [Candidatus Micrarchaeota archaeon]|nr:hydroxymethylbilane synthase [Candidatus Micrarchaeota archaeon]